MSRTLGALALALFLLMFLVVTAPARLLGLVLPSGQVFAEGFSGTLWQGEASRCLLKTPAGYLHLGAVGWQLDPWSLLVFAPRLTIESIWGSQTLVTELVLSSSEEIELYELDANIPADLLRQFVPVSLGGIVSLQLKHLHLLAGVPVEGEGRVVWQGGAWNAPNGPVPLGSYALDFLQVPDSALVGEVITLAGEVAAQGQVRLERRTYDIDITVQREGGLDQRLGQALSLMARPVEQGFHIKLDGEF